MDYYRHSFPQTLARPSRRPTIRFLARRLIMRRSPLAMAFTSTIPPVISRHLSLCIEHLQVGNHPLVQFLVGPTGGLAKRAEVRSGSLNRFPSALPIPPPPTTQATQA